MEMYHSTTAQLCFKQQTEWTEKLKLVFISLTWTASRFYFPYFFCCLYYPCTVYIVLYKFLSVAL